MAQEHNLVFTPAYLDQRHGRDGQRPSHGGLTEGAFLEFPYDPPEWGLDRRDYMMAEPLEVDADGMIVLPRRAGPGLSAQRGDAGAHEGRVRAIG